MPGIIIVNYKLSFFLTVDSFIQYPDSWADAVAFEHK